MTPDYEFEVFVPIFIEEMRKLAAFTESTFEGRLQWTGPNALLIKMYDDFVLLRVPVPGLVDRDDCEFVYDDAWKLVKHILYIEPNNHVEVVLGNWAADLPWSSLEIRKISHLASGEFMNSKDMLAILEKDNSWDLGECLQEGGDKNTIIKRKSLIEHAITFKAMNCTDVLLLWGADCTSVKANKKCFEILKSDPSFMRMVQEIETSESRKSPQNIQYFMDELSKNICGNHPLSNRDTLSYRVNGINYLYCGLHQFEYVNFEFLTESVRDALECDNATTGKYAMVVTAITRSMFGEADASIFSERLSGFLVLREAPVHQLPNLLNEIRVNIDELLIGVHYSDTESAIWEDKDGSMDIGGRFLKTMRTVVESYRKPVTFKMSHNFLNMNEWSHDLNRWVMQFKKIHGVFPNILLASGNTYSRIDMVANARGKDKIRNSEGETSEKEFVSMSGFAGKGYTLDSCIDDRLEVGCVKLIFDHGPGGGGEPVDGYEGDHFDAVAG